MQSLPETCPDVQAALPLYVGADLEPAEQEAVREHLEGCGTCRAAHEAARSSRAVFRSLDPGEVPADLDLWPALRGRLADEGLLKGRSGRKETPIHSLSRWRRLAVGAVAAAAALLVSVQLGPSGEGAGPAYDRGTGLAGGSGVTSLGGPTSIQPTDASEENAPAPALSGGLRLANDEDERLLDSAVDVLQGMTVRGGPNALAGDRR